MNFGIQYVKIENFRVIRYFESDLSDTMNVFFGMNGAGKTTLLSAISILMSWFTARLQNRKGRGTTLQEEDITIGEPFCRLTITLCNGVSWSLYRQRSLERYDNEQGDYTELTGYTDDIADHLRNNTPHYALPIVMNYMVERAANSGTVVLTSEQKAPSPFDIYATPKGGKRNSFSDFFLWFRQREDMENQAIARGKEIVDNQLYAVRKALGRVFPDYHDFIVDRVTNTIQMMKGDETFSFNQLSDGERCYIAIVADIARRLAMAGADTIEPLDGIGVVMIDEVELHLHVRWQSEVVSKLRAVFPYVQFLLTSHSAHVFNSVNAKCGEKVFLVDNGNIQPLVGNAYSYSTDRALREIFGFTTGLYNPEVTQHLSLAWTLLSKTEVDMSAFKLEYDWLTEHLDANDIQMIRMGVEIRKRQLAL